MQATWTVRTNSGIEYYTGINEIEAKRTYMQVAIISRTNMTPAPHIFCNGTERRIVATVSALARLEGRL